MQIYVGNLARDVTADQLRSAFAPLGAVTRAVVMQDASSGRSKGFGFVFMPNRGHAQQAVDALHATLMQGSRLQVNEMLPMTPHDAPRSGS
ncbi:MAG: RNA-binding protein [Gammaproteobacteria bacterium]|jgi:RNA recognition motif-containing protein|nr:RNA-binding protein [Gammaproteobacteria bacterium]